MRIEELADVDREVVDAVERLLPQLSSSAPPLSRDDIQQIVEAEAATVFVARIDDRVVGMLTLVTFTIPTGVRAWIEDVVVDQDARGRSIGKALTRRALEHAAENGARTVDLTSRPSRETANTMYESLGFHQRDTNVYRYELPAD